MNIKQLKNASWQQIKELFKSKPTAPAVKQSQSKQVVVEPVVHETVVEPTTTKPKATKKTTDSTSTGE